MRRRLIKAKEVELVVPEDRLEKMTDEAAARIAQRTWSDNTGKHRVIATYGGVSGDRVRLTKPNGKESLVPMSRLSEVDRAYVQSMQSEGGVPLASSARGGTPAVDALPKQMRAKFKKLRTVKGRDFSEWSFIPPAGAPPADATPASSSVSFTKGADTGNWGEELVRLAVAADGSAAMGIRKWGTPNDETHMVQRLDLIRGVAEPGVKVPPKTVVLDVEPKSGLVLTRRDRFGHGKNTKLRINRLSGGRLIPVSQWEPGPEAKAYLRSDVDQARFLSADRLLVKVMLGNWVVWDAKTATALYEIPIQHGRGIPIVTDPLGRVMAIGASGGVSLIDLERGKHVATLEHELGRVSAVAINENVTRLAAWGERGLSLWDLTTGSLLHGMARPLRVKGDSLEMVGDYVLLGGRYLLDPSRGIVLWEYSVASNQHGGNFGVVRPRFRAGRLWYAPESERMFPIYVASIAWPHAPVQEVLASLSDGEAMTVAKQGDTARVIVETDLPPHQRQQLQAAVEDNLAKAGYRVVQDGDATVEATVTCRALPKRTLRINLSRSPLPDAWDIIEREIEPYLSSIVLRVADQDMWSEGWRTEPSLIFLEEGETLDDALKRLTTPDIRLLMEMEFPSRLARRGDATPTGAYGKTRLGPKS